jgi:chemotaxis signal transduction protein
MATEIATAASSIKVITFAIAGYRLALPMESVVRIVNCPEDLQQRSGAVELIHLGQTAIAVLNLHFHLSLNQNSASPGQFLIVTKVGQELCAIRVDTPPNLVELDARTLRQLPSPYRQGHPLNIASRVAVLPQGKATLAIFILEMQRVLDAIVK